MAMHRAPVGRHGSTRCASNGARSLRRGVSRSLRRTTALRAQIQQHLSGQIVYFARNRCSLLRVGGCRSVSVCPGRTSPGSRHTRPESGGGRRGGRRCRRALLADATQLLGVPVQPPVLENLPACSPGSLWPPLTSRRLEIRLTTSWARVRAGYRADPRQAGGVSLPAWLHRG